eukprot:774518-Pyramimonas_sp.AAC.1
MASKTAQQAPQRASRRPRGTTSGHVGPGRLPATIPRPLDKSRGEPSTRMVSKVRLSRKEDLTIQCRGF